jgi:putative transposase
LTDRSIFLVTRLKTNAAYRVARRRSVLRNKGSTCDKILELTGIPTAKKCPIPQRRIGYRDAKTVKHYLFLIDNLKLSAKTIADIYKARWQVELFFEWTQQNLTIKSFLGTSKNAVMTRIWIALCIYLLAAFIKLQSQLTKSLQQILRLLQLNLFEQRDLMDFFRGDPPYNRQLDTNLMVLL